MNERERFREVVFGWTGKDHSAPTERELEVAHLAIVDGFTHQEIAKQLRIAPGTVKAHLGRFAAKTGRSLRECRHGLARAFWSAQDTDVSEADNRRGQLAVRSDRNTLE